MRRNSNDSRGSNHRPNPSEQIVRHIYEEAPKKKSGFGFTSSIVLAVLVMAGSWFIYENRFAIYNGLVPVINGFGAFIALVGGIMFLLGLAGSEKLRHRGLVIGAIGFVMAILHQV